jgi:transposase
METNMPTPPTARDALNEFGIDAICQDVSDGKSLTAIAKSVGTTIGSICTWLAADPERSARATAARRTTAWYWDEQAERELREAEPTTEGIARARELASHFRWRSSKINPRDYGDKVDVNHAGAIGIRPAPIDTSKLTVEQREVFREILLLAQARGQEIEGDAL